MSICHQQHGSGWLVGGHDQNRSLHKEICKRLRSLRWWAYDYLILVQHFTKTCVSLMPCKIANQGFLKSTRRRRPSSKHSPSMDTIAQCSPFRRDANNTGPFSLNQIQQHGCKKKGRLATRRIQVALASGNSSAKFLTCASVALTPAQVITHFPSIRRANFIIIKLSNGA
jgi:hypothetical protein